MIAFEQHLESLMSGSADRPARRFCRKANAARGVSRRSAPAAASGARGGARLRGRAAARWR